MNRLKVIIFGVSRVLEQYLSQIDMETVIAFANNNPQKYANVFGSKKVISPDQITLLDYDYIVLFTLNSNDQIYQQLINEIGVQDEKIISWQYFLQISGCSRQYYEFNSIINVFQMMKDMGMKNILDIHMAFERFSIFTKNFGGRGDFMEMKIDGFQEAKKVFLPIFENIYDNVYTDLNVCKTKHYDTILFLDLFVNHTVSECAELIESTYNMSKYTVLTIPFPYPKKNNEWYEFDFAKYGKVHVMNIYLYKIILIDKTNHNTGALKIYVATHKQFTPPSDDIYIPIHAGKAGKNSLGFIGDDTGLNISKLNPVINECTALYWIWKHAECSYIGFNQYRRYFLKSNIWNDINNIVDEETVMKILYEYDIILPNQLFTHPNNIARQLNTTICEDAYQIGKTLIRDIIEKKHADYLPIFDELFHGFAFYPCNLFITSKNIMNQYCEWLFDIIIEAAENIDVSKYDSYSKRIIGFMAERLFTVWIMKNKLRIKELPILLTE